MVGGYGHLQYRGHFLSVSHVPKDVAVEVERVREVV
jgi:hypothetical protein